MYTQYAALPFRRRPDGATEVLLVTSRTTRRWIIPKGWPIEGATPAGTARQEALEEAGLIGRIGDRSLGSFHYRKRLKRGGAVTCEVHVYPMNVRRQRRHWPEKRQRKTRWFSADAAAAAVREPGLRRLIAKLPNGRDATDAAV
jgi:8-oxo-dGTP pyrophosphatase MutT (NUDIX family)